MVGHFSGMYLLQVGISPSDPGNKFVERKEGVQVVESGPRKNIQGENSLGKLWETFIAARLLQLWQETLSLMDFAWHCPCQSLSSPRFASCHAG